MVDLATSPREHPITTISLAERRGVSQPYIEVMVACLRRSGLIEGLKGPGGGYVLARPARAIRLSAIAHAVQRNANPRRRGPKSRREKVPLRPCPSDLIWDFIDEATRDLLEHVTLDDLARAPAGESGKTLARKELSDQARYKDGLPGRA